MQTTLNKPYQLPGTTPKYASINGIRLLGGAASVQPDLGFNRFAQGNANTYAVRLLACNHASSR